MDKIRYSQSSGAAILNRAHTLSFRVTLVVIIFTSLLSLPRFAHHTPDSRRYIKVAEYFRGDISRIELVGPYAYRVLVPLVAALIPLSNLDINFALLNILATILAYLIFARYLQQFVSSRTELNVGLFLLVVSFPSFNYASGVLTDPVAFLILVAAAYLLLKERYYLLSCVICLGVLARESMLIMALATAIYIGLGWRQSGASWIRSCVALAVVSIPPTVVFLAVRAYFEDVPSNFYWGLSLDGFLKNIKQPIGWTTFLLTLGPPLCLFVIGFRRSGLTFFQNLLGPQRQILLALTIVSILYIIYSNSIATAYMSGRFAWPFYTALIPIAVLSSTKTRIYTNILAPVSNYLFGNDDDTSHRKAK